MAESARPSRPGDVTTRQGIRLPVWVWAVVAGGALVVGWKFYQARQAAASNAVSSTTSDADQANAPTSIVPVPVATATGESAGESAQLAAILAAIQAQQGAPSTDTGSTPVTATPQPGPTTTPVNTSGTADQCTYSYYTVQKGDTLTSIAAKFPDKSGDTAQKIFEYNTTGGHRAAAAEQTIAQRGINLIYAGEQFLVPDRNC